MENQEFNVLQEQQPEKRKGCFTWGRCLGCSAVGLLLVMALVGGGGYWLYQWVVNNLFEDEPIEIEQIAYTEGEADALQRKIKEFAEQSKEQQAELTLTEDEVNMLVLEEIKKGGGPIRGFRAKFLDGDKAEVSMSMELGKDKYLNLRAKGNFEINKGVVRIAIDEGKVGKLDVPELYNDQLSQSVNDGLRNDPQMRSAIDRIEELKIEEGKARLKLKKPQTRVEETKTGA